MCPESVFALDFPSYGIRWDVYWFAFGRFARPTLHTSSFLSTHSWGPLSVETTCKPTTYHGRRRDARGKPPTPCRRKMRQFPHSRLAYQLAAAVRCEGAREVLRPLTPFLWLADMPDPLTAGVQTPCASSPLLQTSQAYRRAKHKPSKRALPSQRTTNPANRCRQKNSTKKLTAKESSRNSTASMANVDRSCCCGRSWTRQRRSESAI